LSPNRWVFLDRDGVINRDSPDYIKHWSEFEFLPGSLAAMAGLCRHGFRIIVITNQSGIGRGLIRLQDLAEMHARLKEAVEDRGGRIEDIFLCPHRPDDNCSCRKPKPGLIQAAQARYGIDLSAAVMIGDSAKDILCACLAGCAHSILVQSDRAAGELDTLDREGCRPDYVARDLFQAARWIIAHAPSAPPPAANGAGNQF
jgi:D-glycero-D-manno-heptose 1,7-bisphosphate phosphatase